MKYTYKYIMDEFDLFNRICITSKTRSGKSFLARFLIDKYKNHFDKIILICPTEKMNRFYEGLVKEQDIYETVDEEWIKQLFNRCLICSKTRSGKSYLARFLIDNVIRIISTSSIHYIYKF